MKNKINTSFIPGIFCCHDVYGENIGDISASSIQELLKKKPNTKYVTGFDVSSQKVTWKEVTLDGFIDCERGAMERYRATIKEASITNNLEIPPYLQIGAEFIATDSRGTSYTYRFEGANPKDTTGCAYLSLYNMDMDCITNVEYEWFQNRQISCLNQSKSQPRSR